jgi:hypothetical protein
VGRGEPPRHCLTVLPLVIKRSWKDSGSPKPIGIACFGQVAEFASRLRKDAHIHVTGFLRSRDIVKNGTGRGKKAGARAKVRAWEVRAIRIAKLDRAVQEDPSNDIPANHPAL